MRRNVIAGRCASENLVGASHCGRSSVSRAGHESTNAFRRPKIAARLCLGVVLLLNVLGSNGSTLFQKSESRTEMAAAKFPALVAEYLRDLHARHPALAAASGLHVWDSQLEDYSALAISSEISAIKSFQQRLEKIPPLELQLTDTFDYQILASNMNARLLELETIKS